LRMASSLLANQRQVNHPSGLSNLSEKHRVVVVAGGVDVALEHLSFS
jgi:hypothetical protein